MTSPPAGSKRPSIPESPKALPALLSRPPLLSTYSFPLFFGFLLHLEREAVCPICPINPCGQSLLVVVVVHLHRSLFCCSRATPHSSQPQDSCQKPFPSLPASLSRLAFQQDASLFDGCGASCPFLAHPRREVGTLLGRLQLGVGANCHKHELYASLTES